MRRLIGVVFGLSLLSLFAVSQANEAIKDASLFFQQYDAVSARLSPDGRYVALVSLDDGEPKLKLWDSQSGQSSVLVELSTFTPRDASIRFVDWIGPNHLVAQFIELKEGVKNLLDTKPSYRLIVIEVPKTPNAKPLIREVKTKGWLVHPLAAHPGRFLYAKSGLQSKVYEIDVSKLSVPGKKLSKLVRKDGGQFNKTNQKAWVDGYATRWFFDQEGEPNSVLYFNQDGLNLSAIEKGEAQEPLRTWSNEELETDITKLDSNPLYLPLVQTEDKHSYYCYDSHAYRNNAVYLCNFSSNEQTLLYQSGSYEITELIVSDDTRELIGVKVLQDGRLHNQYFNESSASSNVSGKVRVSVGKSQDQKVELYYQESFTQPGRFFIASQNMDQDRLVGSQYPHLDQALKGTQEVGRIEVEGLNIPFVLSLPSSKGTHPLLLVPHGGPIGIFDHEFFNSMTQYFVANGYAVLRVNYRGSGGFGEEFEEAGKGEWGGLMLEDLSQVTSSITQRSDIDASRVCSVGMSYGGYASLMMAIQHPSIFNCVVSIAGVTDIPLFLNSPNPTQRQDIWLREYVGDGVDEYEVLRDISPLYKADELERPVYLIHGQEDEIVDVEHLHRMRLMLEKYGKTYEWYVYPEMKHAIEDVALKRELYASVLNFVSSNISTPPNTKQ